MATLRKFIGDQSSLPPGNTIRDHINNPKTSSGSGTVAVHGGLEAAAINTTEAETVVTLDAVAIEVNDAVEVEATAAQTTTDTEASS